ncbi:hypothetical protein EBT31_21355, partial [bacterium]|nr:hypothetical protein [bacterium]
MMIRDFALLQQIQMALIGIVVVAGMFYLWRSIIRLEEKIEGLQSKIAMQASDASVCKMRSGGGSSHCIVEDAADAADAFMKQVFGDDADAMPFLYSASAQAAPNPRQVIVEEIPAESPATPPAKPEEAEVVGKRARSSL